jgi:hypothetical protein
LHSNNFNMIVSDNLRICRNFVIFNSRYKDKTKM